MHCRSDQASLRNSLPSESSQAASLAVSVSLVFMNTPGVKSLTLSVTSSSIGPESPMLTVIGVVVGCLKPTATNCFVGTSKLTWTRAQAPVVQVGLFGTTVGVAEICVPPTRTTQRALV